ncbi:hypothetical protein [Pseudomonas monteilii]|uniref:Uncharacterized protein n=1 Tax=Pseudomonas monteilii TaxID=76759 RepID=A0A2N1IY44_9PSED|nr:hypothetical protein [Pseudomonas monteilii]PKI25670.1 hypothetical protein CXB65_02875 [Pseudomonas monteilii]RPD94733.1 hypothetical protein EGN69_00345 [Pseudomonas monteilii]
MANVKQSKAVAMKMAERAQAVMDLHYPNYAPEWLWIRGKNHGFSTVPRTLPIAMQALNELPGHPAGHTLFCLWARSPDHPLVIIESQATFAGEAGFTGSRAVDTWRRRMKILKEHGFIDTRKGTSGEFHYVLLLNPNVALERMHALGHVSTDVYSRFTERLSEIGGYGDVTTIREFWHRENEAKALAEAKAAEEAAKAEEQKKSET